MIFKYPIDGKRKKPHRKPENKEKTKLLLGGSHKGHDLNVDFQTPSAVYPGLSETLIHPAGLPNFWLTMEQKSS